MGSGKKKRLLASAQKQPIQEKPSVFSRRIAAGLLLCIGIWGFLVYAGSLNGRFLWDDKNLVVDNAYIKDWSHGGRIFTGSIGQGAQGHYAAYRPLQIVSYAVDYSFWKLAPLGYHLTSVLLHIAAAFCVFWLLSILFGNPALSFLAGLFFVIHPVHTEAVSYISGRADPLASIFLLLTLIFYIKSLRRESGTSFFLMGVSYAAALLSRENSLILPALILVYHGFFKEKICRKKFFFLLGLAGFYAVLRVTLFREFLSDGANTTHLWERLPGVFAAIAGYARVLILPFDLHMEYCQRLFLPGDIRVLVGFVLALGLIFLAWQQHNRRRILAFSVTWFFVALFPVSNIFPINAYMAEHWLYLPSIGFFLALARFFQFFYEQKKFRAAALCAACALAVFFSFLTIRQNSYWSEPRSFFEKTLAYAPESPRVMGRLAEIYKDSGRLEEAAVLLKKAAALTPGDPEVYNTLGMVAEKRGQVEESGGYYKSAIELYRKEIELKPDSATAYNNLGFALMKIGRKRDARTAFKKAAELDPRNAEALGNLAASYQGEATSQDMLDLEKNTVGISPDNPEAYNNLGILYQKKGDLQKAEEFYKKAIELDPRYTAAYNNLGTCYKTLNRFPEAAASYEKAIAVDRGYADAYCNLGFIFLKTGDFNQAIGTYKKALEIDPNNAGAYNNLGTAYQNTGRIKEAAAAYAQAVRLCPQDVETRINLGQATQQLGQWEESIAAFKSALAIAPSRPETYNFLAIAYGAAGKKNDALFALKKAIETDPDYLPAYQNLVTIYYSEKQYDLAMEYCDKGMARGATFDPDILKTFESLRGKQRAGK